MWLARLEHILFSALCLLCIANCSAEENGGCQEGLKDHAHDGSPSRIYQDGTHVYQYGDRSSVQSDFHCTTPQGLLCGASRDKLIQESVAQQQTENVSAKNKGDKLRELLETPSLNRSRPIAWIDDYNVSTCNFFVVDMNEILRTWVQSYEHGF